MLFLFLQCFFNKPLTMSFNIQNVKFSSNNILQIRTAETFASFPLPGSVSCRHGRRTGVGPFPPPWRSDGLSDCRFDFVECGPRLGLHRLVSSAPARIAFSRPDGGATATVRASQGPFSWPRNLRPKGGADVSDIDGGRDVGSGLPRPLRFDILSSKQGFRCLSVENKPFSLTGT